MSVPDAPATVAQHANGVLPADCDLLVVGGGVNGAGIARDAAGRGLRVVVMRGHSPAITCGVADHAPRSITSMAVIAHSATATSLAPVAGQTAMPRALQASTSMLSRPTPRRPTTRSFGAASSRAPRTWVRLRTTSARASASAAARSAGRSTSFAS